jgi:hypothetical protein
MRDVMEMIMVRQVFGGGESWIQAVFLAGVFLVLLFRRDHIVSPYMFRVSIILFVLSMVLPVIIVGIMQFTGATPSPIRSVGDSLLQVLMTGTGPVLLGLAVLLCILSMLPAHSRYPAPPERPPQPHPLD